MNFLKNILLLFIILIIIITFNDYLKPINNNNIKTKYNTGDTIYLIQDSIPCVIQEIEIKKDFNIVYNVKLLNNKEIKTTICSILYLEKCFY
jgi:transcriptional regulator